MSEAADNSIHIVEVICDEKNSSAFHESIGQKFFIFLRNSSQAITLPSGKFFTASNSRIAEFLVNRMEINSQVNFQDFSVTALHSSLKDHTNPAFDLQKANIKSMLMLDPYFYPYHGRLRRYSRAIFHFSQEYGLKSVRNSSRNFKLGEDYNWTDSRTSDWIPPEEFESWVNALWLEFQALTNYEKATLYFLYQESDRCLLQSLMLLTKRYSIIEFVRATSKENWASSNPDNTSIREAVTKSYHERLPAIIDMLEYVRVKGERNNQNANFELNNLIPNLSILPDTSRECLISAHRMLNDSELIDYSPVIIQLAKVIEIPLKKLIFDEFREDIRFEQVLIVKGKKKQAIKFKEYIDKEPPRIGLGEMVTILRLHGGRTEREEPLLQTFFQFIQTRSPFPGVLKKEVLDLISDLAIARNKAAHSDVNKEQSAYSDFFDSLVKILNDMAPPGALTGLHRDQIN